MYAFVYVLTTTNIYVTNSLVTITESAVRPLC